MKRSNRSPLWRLPVEREVEEELELHLAMRVREYMDEGLDEEEATRRAQARFGDVKGYAADCRRLAARRNRRWRWTGVLDDLRQEARFALRQLRRRPVYALSLVGMLALGIGATTAVTGLVIEALLAPPPYGEPERIATVWEAQTQRGWAKNVVSPANFLAMKASAPAFEHLAAFITVTANLTGEGPPQRVRTRWVTEGYFEALGRAPRLGRYFTFPTGSAESQENAPQEVILSHGLWRQRFGGDPDVVGRVVQLDGESQEVIGVLPAGTDLDMGAAFAPYGSRPDLYRPLPDQEAWRTPRGRWLMLVGRLSDGVDLSLAQSQLEAAMSSQAELHPGFNEGWTVTAVPLAEHLREPLRTPLLALFGAVMLVLVIVCINGSNLLLGRTLSRLGELRVRSALGAGGLRLGRQLLVEGAVVAMLAGLIGWLLSVGLLAWARPLVPAELIAPGTLEQPARELWLPAVVLTLAVTLIFGLLPLLPASRRTGRLGAARSSGQSRGLRRLRSGLVFGQMVFALVLLVGAGLMLRTVLGLVNVDPGFESSGAISFAVSPEREAAEVLAFYDELEQRLAALPGVSRVGAVTHLPMASAGAATSFYATDQPEPEPGQAPVADVRILRGDYLGAMGITVLEGREFSAQDSPEAPGVVLVSRRLADRLWAGESAIGQRISVNWGEGGPREIVGVVEDVHHRALGAEARDAIYFPQAQEMQTEMTLVLRGGGAFAEGRALEPLADPIRSIVRELDPALAVFDLQTLETVVETSVQRERFLARMLGAFAALALLLAAMGIYSTAALRVRESRREIGLRMALGAAPEQLMKQWLGRSARLTAVAVLTGLGLAWALGRSLESLLFGVAVTDPMTLVVTAALLGVTSLLAALLPARTAARLDPTVSLREE